MKPHAAAFGSATNGTTNAQATDEPATTAAVSSMGSPPGADLSSAFHDACSRPAPITASVTPRLSSGVGINRATPPFGMNARNGPECPGLRDARLAFVPRLRLE